MSASSIKGILKTRIVSLTARKNRCQIPCKEYVEMIRGRDGAITMASIPTFGKQLGLINTSILLGSDCFPTSEEHLLNIEELNLKVEGGIGGNDTSCSARSVR